MEKWYFGRKFSDMGRQKHTVLGEKYLGVRYESKSRTVYKQSHNI